MSVADASPPSSVTLLSTKRRHSVQLYPLSDPQNSPETVLEKIQQVFTPGSSHARRRRSQELTSPHLTPTSRSHSPDGGEFTFSVASSVYPDYPGSSSALSRDISLEEELQSKVLQLAHEVAMLKNKCRRQQKENSNLAKSLEVYQKECRSVVDSLKEVYDAKMEELQKALAKTAKARDDIQNEKATLEAAFKQMLDFSEKEKKSLQSELAESKEQSVKARRCLVKVESKLASVEKANTILAQENEELRKEIESMKSLRETDLSKAESKLRETEMRNGFYQMLFEVAVNKVKYVEERQQQQQPQKQRQQQQQQQQQQPKKRHQKQQTFCSSETSQSSSDATTPDVFSPSQDRTTVLPRTPSNELLQTLYDGVIWNDNSQKSLDSQSVDSFRSGDSVSGAFDSLNADQTDSKEPDALPVRTYARGHSEPNILSPFFFGSQGLMPKFDLASPNESDETCSSVSAGSSRLSSEQSIEFTGSPSSRKTSGAPRGRGGRAPLLKSYTLDDDRVAPRMKFRTNTDPSDEEILVSNDYVIVDSSMNIIRDEEEEEEDEEDEGEDNNDSVQDRVSPRSGFQMLKERRNGITDMSEIPRLTVKGKKKKGRELAGIFRKLTSSSHGEEKKSRKFSHKRSKSVKD